MEDRNGKQYLTRIPDYGKVQRQYVWFQSQKSFLKNREAVQKDKEIKF